MRFSLPLSLSTMVALFTAQQCWAKGGNNFIEPSIGAEASGYSFSNGEPSFVGGVFGRLRLGRAPNRVFSWGLDFQYSYLGLDSGAPSYLKSGERFDLGPMIGFTIGPVRLGGGLRYSFIQLVADSPEAQQFGKDSPSGGVGLAELTLLLTESVNLDFDFRYSSYEPNDNVHHGKLVDRTLLISFSFPFRNIPDIFDQDAANAAPNAVMMHPHMF